MQQREERPEAQPPRTSGLRPVEPTSGHGEPYIADEPLVTMRARDLLRWSSVWAGFFLSLGLVVLLGALGIAIGLSVSGPVGTGAAIWGAITVAVSFFGGGWLAGRTSAIAGPMVGTLQGVAVWALTTTALFVLGATGTLGALLGMSTSAAPAGGVIGAMTIATSAAWGTFAVLLIGLMFACIGGWVGGQDLPEHTPGQ